ncbi:reverse transcriptase zinc-binding domain-containing protein [Artemisia annua]|uniref:Reverse transcriptase zinc-binding domain-containing protein n=1 Tax=Artemisia annua TaxID=35608 RepID=A0A2U1KZA5_ARTAN|nr:reverse transcriptase zinc-binding domain-containing protein [Artemisia annua]
MAELFEYEMKGSKFTYLKDDDRGRKMSKIDRCLVNKEVFNEWPEACFRSLPRGHSDHNPILLSLIELNFGPKPFRFFNSWLDLPDCEKTVVKALDSFVFKGPPDVKLMRKFKWLRKHLKEWRDELLSKEGEEFELCNKELFELEMNMEESDLTEEEEWTRLECGLGLCRLWDTNVALLVKWIWRYRTEPESLWRKVIEALHDTKRSWTPIPFCKSSYSVWGTIVKTCSKIQVGGIGINQMFKGKIGNGKHIRFWLDPWVSNEPLKDVFPSLFKMAKDKRCTVADGLLMSSNRFGGITGSQNSRMIDGGNIELSRLESMMDGIFLSDEVDKWSWIGNKHKEFSVKAVKDFLNSVHDYSNRFVLSWSKWVPKKCNIFMWRVGLDRIQTASALRRRN